MAAALRKRPSGRRLALLAVVTVVLLGLAAAAVRSWGGDGWDSVWHDDFDGDGGSAPSARDWIVTTGTQYPGGAAQWGTGELQTYTADPANIALDGEGNLRITPTRDAAGAWQSGRMETRRADFEPAAGGKLKVEARIRIPDGGPGYWAAFWMLGEPYRPDHTDWPGAGEIDVMENVGTEPTNIYGTLHCGVFEVGPCKETTGLGASTPAPEPFATGFHTYAVEWDRSLPTEELRWYVDGTKFHTVRASEVDAATWERATGHGYYVLLNVAIGGGWPGPPDASTRPGQSMLVDRVDVSRQD